MSPAVDGPEFARGALPSGLAESAFQQEAVERQAVSVPERFVLAESVLVELVQAVSFLEAFGLFLAAPPRFEVLVVVLAFDQAALWLEDQEPELQVVPGREFLFLALVPFEQYSVF